MQGVSSVLLQASPTLATMLVLAVHNLAERSAKVPFSMVVRPTPLLPVPDLMKLVHEVASVEACHVTSLPAAAQVLLDCVSKKLHPLDLKCRQVGAP